MTDNTITPDLLDTLTRIADRAKKTRESIAAGTAINGTHGLGTIEHEARDALLRAGVTDGST